MDGKSDSVDLLVSQDSPECVHANVNQALQVADSESTSETASLTSAPIATDNPQPSIPPEPVVPPATNTITPETTTTDKTLLEHPIPTVNTSEASTPEAAAASSLTATENAIPQREASSKGTDDAHAGCSNMEDGGSTAHSTTPAPAPHMCHSRGDSQVSSCEASLGRISGREYCHSRGASTDGSLMEGYTSSVIDSRRGTYSEAGTLPIGSTIIEENLQGWDRQSDEKKLSSSTSSDVKYSEKLLSSCSCCKTLLRKNHQLSEHPTFCEFVQYSVTCPPHGRVGDWLLWVVMGLAGWGCLVAVTGAAALPGGNLFSLVVMYVTAVAGAAAVGEVGLPPLLGSLLVGILLSSIPGINVVGQSVDVHWSSALRNIALVIILIRAGLGLDPVALKKLSSVVLRLACLPCLVEAIVTAIVSHFLLSLPWLWSFMLGFIVAAVSPAVVVPTLLQLGEAGYGVEQGIPTLVIAAASIDDVLAITGFSVMLTLTFSTGSLYWTICKGPVEIVVGLFYGAVFGMLCWFLPYKEKDNRPIYKFVILFVLGALGMFGSHMVGLKSSGPISVLSLAFVAGLGWRQPEHEDPEVGNYYRQVWQVIQPLLFVLIGAKINVGELQFSTIGWGLLTLLVGLSLRIVTSFLVVFGGGFNIRERLFISIAWLPKATVQAAIGSSALDYVQRNGGSKADILWGEKVVTLAVMVILVTAPIGAAAMKLTAPKFLARKLPNPETSNDLENPV